MAFKYRQKIVVRWLLLSVMLTLGCQESKSIADHPFFKDDQLLIFAHRGGRGIGPEHTMPTYHQAVHAGVDVLELDLRTTRDNQLVIIHDNTVDRCTNGSGMVVAHTLADLKKLDAGYRWRSDADRHYPFRNQGLTIPTLLEVFETFPHIRFNIEIKSAAMPAVASLCQLIRTHGKTDQVLVASFGCKPLDEFRRLCPEVATSACASEARTFYWLNKLYLASLYQPPFEALQVPETFGKLRIISKRFVTAAHGKRIKVHVWTVNDSKQFERLLALNVDGIITDYPKRFTGQKYRNSALNRP
ncbi:MAG: glycerophosphodiester phosphodiesterase [Desulfobacterales bacterium]|nr:glycerophosphodiester phosphodiesterase [Desulfobacterales bacterium]